MSHFLIERTSEICKVASTVHDSQYSNTMLSLSRRKPLRQRGEPLNSLVGLPDDVLILICSQCRIDELFTLRMTSAKLRSIIDEYITSIAPSVARSTFPLCEHLLARNAITTTFRSLKALIPEQLASILVDRHRIVDEWMHSRYGIPAEDAFGDTLRNRVASGWRVLRNLSNISRAVYCSNSSGPRKSPAHFANRVFRPTQSKLETLIHTEDMILQKRLDYLALLGPRQAQDYKVMFVLLSSAFSTSISNIGDEHRPWPFDFGRGIDGQRELRKGESWLSWFVLAEGPDLFWRQWWALPDSDPTTRHSIRDRAIEAFTNTPQKLSDHQRVLARTFQVAVNEHALLESQFDESNPVRYFAQYAEHRLHRRQAGLPPAQEVLGNVPFFIHFRCPEEVVKAHEAVEEERNASRANQPWPR
jgi:hypothetical protein